MVEETTILTVRIPKKLLEELELKVPKNRRSVFVREAIEEKIRKIPVFMRLKEIEDRLERLENEVGEVKKVLAEFDLLTYEREKNPYSFCQDEVDKKIVEFLIQQGGATTSEIAKHVGLNRWLILNRLKRLSQRTEKRFGKPAIYFLAVERMGRKRAWWIDEKLLA